MTEQQIIVPQSSLPITLKGEQAAPVLFLSSEGAGWEGLKARAYHEPVHYEGWIVPDAPDISLILFAGGTMRMEQRHVNSSWKELHMRQGDLFLSLGRRAPYELRWNSLSSEPTQTLHLHLSTDLLSRTAEEMGGQDLAHLTLLEQVGFQDPLLTQIGLALWRELEQSAPAGKLYAQTAAQMLAVHLLHHYASTAIEIKEFPQGLTRQQVKRVTDFMRAHLDQDLSLETLAEQIGFSVYYFARLFQQTMGVKPAPICAMSADRAGAASAQRDGYAPHSNCTGVWICESEPPDPGLQASPWPNPTQLSTEALNLRKFLTRCARIYKIPLFLLPYHRSAMLTTNR